MRRIRFTIASLVGVIFVLGVSFAALRESNDLWDSSVFSITLGVLLISMLLSIHRTAKRRAFWLGFALFGSAYLAMSLVPSVQPRLMTTRALAYLASKVPRSIPNGAGLVYADFDNDGDVDLYVASNSQPNVLYVNKGNGAFEDATSAAGSTTAWIVKSLAGPRPAGSSGTTENFIRIGHLLLALIAALLGGQLSRYLYTKNTQRSSAPIPAPVSMPSDSGV